MSIYCAYLKREDNKIYIAEESGNYAVLFGREELAEVVFETHPVMVRDSVNPDDKEKARCLWVVLQHRKDCMSALIEDFSSFKPSEAWIAAHTKALEFAVEKLEVNKLIRHLPNYTGPILEKIIDNSGYTAKRENSDLIEYVKEHVRFEL
jgi:hypothetical protein